MEYAIVIKTKRKLTKSKIEEIIESLNTLGFKKGEIKLFK